MTVGVIDHAGGQETGETQDAGPAQELRIAVHVLREAAEEVAQEQRNKDRGRGEREET
jgi:hypothetical protein